MVLHEPSTLCRLYGPSNSRKVANTRRAALRYVWTHTMTPDRVVLHADMDAFYASIEQRDHPEFRGKPVIVGAVSARGVVAAASYEARRFGVHSAMPGYEAKRLCPNGIFLGCDMAKYGSVSEKLHHVFAEFTPEIESIALDEAFLDITGSVGLFGGPLELARRLKQRVKEETDLIISVGIAPNKLVAKIACSLGKPDGLHWCPPQDVAELMAPLPIRRLWGIGPVLAEKLEAAGFRTLGMLGHADHLRLATIVGDRAEPLMALARGEDTREVSGAGDPKSIGEENTFEQDVTDRETIINALRAHAHAIAKRLRRAGFRGKTVTVKLKLAERRQSRPLTPGRLFPLITRRKTLETASSDGQRIAQAAIELWDRVQLLVPVRLVGISVSNLEAASAVQLELFSERSSPERGERLGRVLDAIQSKFGAHCIGPGIETPTKLTPYDRRQPTRGA